MIGALIALGLLLLVPVAAHLAIRRLLRARAEAVATLPGEPEGAGPGLARFHGSYVLEREALLEVGLSGTPEVIGFAHSRLLYRRMVENEGAMLRRFEMQVKSRLARTLLIDLAKLRYRTLGRGMSSERRREIAAGALGFQPDPYAGVLPTYERMLYLNTLYDIALSFEHSPLVGCTTVAFHGDAYPGGGALLARAFDMEIDPIFDRRKAVFLVREDGRLPYASVAWPGLVGVVSGLNLEGVAVVVHGGRAGEPQTHGEPVVHTLRALLGRARTTSEAIDLLQKTPSLVSHILVLADAFGDVRVVERVPGSPLSARVLGPRAAVTNHFEGPARDDPRNRKVIAETSTEARRARADELVQRVTVADPLTALEILRDRSLAGGAALPLGDRRAIDALIATHGVIFDTHTKKVWVSEAPHLLGLFVEFDLTHMLAPGYEPSRAALPALPRDALLDTPERLPAELRAEYTF
jgi:isopenicillin-N N-acyltransferase like protein